MEVYGYKIEPKANLNGADLKRADLKWADLEGADLNGADLKRADLKWADLKRADLKWADLEGANLEGANLEGANLNGANLKQADLKWADLEGANLNGANLNGANLEGANLKQANLNGAKLPHFQICPQEGSFIGYKKTTKGVVKLFIPDTAKRTNSPIGRKCRASQVIVLGGEGVGGTGTNYQGLIYEEGAELFCEDYDNDIRIECTKGIHFFMTLDEAKEWS